MLENFQGDSWGSIPPLRMPSLLPHDLCHGRSASRWLRAVIEFQLSYSRSSLNMQYAGSQQSWFMDLIYNVPLSAHTMWKDNRILWALAAKQVSKQFVWVSKRSTTINRTIWHHPCPQETGVLYWKGDNLGSLLKLQNINSHPLCRIIFSLSHSCMLYFSNSVCLRMVYLTPS